MQIIVITAESYFEDEVEAVVALINSGARVHLRKPLSTEEQFYNFASQIVKRCGIENLVIHKFGKVAEKLNIALHHSFAECKKGDSCSTHSFSEAREADEIGVSYYFLSPVFDSISKVGYKRAFDIEELNNFLSQPQREAKCVALGGITEQNIEKLTSFDSIALLGAVWKRANYNKIDIEQTIAQYLKIDTKWRKLKGCNL